MAVHNGVSDGPHAIRVPVASPVMWPPRPPRSKSRDRFREFELASYTSEATSGQHANNPWLQELPDPLSKMRGQLREHGPFDLLNHRQ